MNFFEKLGLKLRLTLLFVLIFTGSLAVFSYFLYEERLDNRLSEFDANLYNYAIDIAESLDIDSYGVVEFDPGIIKLNEKIFPFSLGKSFISVRDVNGKVVAHSQNASFFDENKFEEKIFNRVLKRGVGYSNLIAMDGKKYRVIYYLLPVLKIDSPLILQITVPYTSIDNSVVKLKHFLIWSIAIILFISVFIGYAFMNRALRPIIDITNKTNSIELKNLNERVPVPVSKDEISELAKTINHLLERLYLSFKSQERFVQDASHQLKTPLAIIKGELELFKSGDDKEKNIDLFLNSMSQELETLIKLTNDLLILARVENNEGNLSLGEYSIEELLLNQISRLSKLAHQKNINLNLNWDGFDKSRPEELKVFVDSDLIGILFYNYIENAIKYSPANSLVQIGGKIEGNEIVIWVKDQGPGITKGQEDKIFNRFFRSEKTSKNQGSGLGLAICKAVAYAHQANIWAENDTSGTGAIFYFKMKSHRG